MTASTGTRNDRASWLQDPKTLCSCSPQSRPNPPHLVLLGAPGVGKGTQAQLLCQVLGACHLSTGDVFRTAKELRPEALSPAMATALEFMRVGRLVPDQTVLDLIRERSGCMVCGGGFILDGFPRTVPQAQALEAQLEQLGIGLDAVLNFTMPLPEIVGRLSGRRTCGSCKAVFHIASRPPTKEGVCDACGGALIQREDDRAESITVRMAAYERSTAPLAAFYEERGLLLNIDACGSPEEICGRATAALEAQAKPKK